MIELLQKDTPLNNAKSIDNLLDICIKETFKIDGVSYVTILEMFDRKISKGHYSGSLLLDINRQKPLQIQKNEIFSIKTTPVFKKALNNNKSYIYFSNEDHNFQKTFQRISNQFNSIIVAPLELKINTFVLIAVSLDINFSEKQLSAINNIIEYSKLKEQNINFKNQSTNQKKLYVNTSIEKISSIFKNLRLIHEKNNLLSLLQDFRKIINCDMFLLAISSTDSSGKTMWYHDKSTRNYDKLNVERMLWNFLSIEKIRVYNDLISKDLSSSLNKGKGFMLRNENIASMLVCPLPWDNFQKLHLFYISHYISAFCKVDINLVQLLNDLFLRFIEGRWSELAVYNAQNSTVMAQQAYLRLHDIRDYSTDIYNVLNQSKEIETIINNLPDNCLSHADRNAYNNYKILMKFAKKSHQKINALKDIIQRTRDGQPLEKEQEFDLETFIYDLIEYFKKDEYFSKKKNIKFKIHQGELSNKTVCTMKRFLEEALINVIKNAIFFSLKDQEITITIFDDVEKENFINISIEDRGTPIRYPAKELIFHPYYSTRAKDLIDAESSQGSGLGLFLSKVNMNSIKGDININSVTIGENTGNVKFILTFPRRLKQNGQ